MVLQEEIQMDLGDMPKGFESTSLQNWAKYMLKANGIDKEFTAEDADQHFSADSRHPDVYSWTKTIDGVDVPLVQWALCLLRPHNCYPSDMPVLWDFMEHFSFVKGSDGSLTRYYSPSAFEKNDAVKIDYIPGAVTPDDDDDDDDDDSSQASNTDQKATGAATPPAATATPATPGVVKPSVIPVPPTTPAADENSKEDAAKPSGEAQDTQESSGEAPQEERIDSMTAQTSDSQESGTEQITETSGKGTNAGRVAAAAAAGAVVVGGGGAAVYVTMIKGKFKFK